MKDLLSWVDMVILLKVFHWFSKLETFYERTESDKAKEGKLLYSLMQALLPVWESLVMLGPDLRGKVEGGKRDETKEGDRRIDKDDVATGNVNFCPFFLGQTLYDEWQVSETQEIKIR